MRTLLLLLVGLGGLWISVRHLLKNVQEIKAKPKDAMRWEDKAINYPLMALWFGYLIVFFAGLIVNNLILR
jgi:hypothetical protein